jgi:hypothetical protein
VTEFAFFLQGSGLNLLMAAVTLKVERISSIENFFVIAFGFMTIAAEIRICFILLIGMMTVDAGNAISGIVCMCFVVK